MQETASSKSSYIKELLIRGATHAEAARLSDVTLGYVSQLLTDAEFARDVELQRTTQMGENRSREARAHKIHESYMDLEELVLGDLQKRLGMLTVPEKIKLLQTVSMKKAPAAAIVAAPREAAPLVSLTFQNLPPQRFIMNEQREILSVGGTDLIPMSSKNLKELAQQYQPPPRTAKEMTELFSLDTLDLGLT